MDELLHKAPMVRPTASMSHAEQQHSWQQWKRECISRRDTGIFMTIPQLHLLTMVTNYLKYSVVKIFNRFEIMALQKFSLYLIFFIVVDTEW